MMDRLTGTLLGRLYDCSDDHGRWTGALDEICRQFDARSAVVQILRRDEHRLRSTWGVRDSFSTANAARHDALVNNADNPRLDLRLTRPLAARPVFRDTDYFNEGCPHLAALGGRLADIGLGRSIGLGIDLPGERYFSLMLHRAVDNGRPFDGDEEGALGALAPHLARVMQISDRLARAEAGREALVTILARLRTGVMLLGDGLRVDWLNDAAQAMVGEKSGGASPLALSRGILTGSDRAVEQALAALVAAARRDGDAIAAVDRHGDDAVQLLAFAVRPGQMPGGPSGVDREMVCLLLSSPEQGFSVDVQDVAALFGLSPAESRLATALYRGLSVNEYAAQRGITVGTARIQLKHVLAKTRSRRQSDLVRQLSLSVSAQASSPRDG
jgi:DNA-binding CsgD family transcriptional regulator